MCCTLPLGLLPSPAPAASPTIHADAMMKAAQQFAQGIAGIDGLEVVGEPEMTVVAFKASRRKAGAPLRTGYGVIVCCLRSKAVLSTQCIISFFLSFFSFFPPPPCRGLDIYKVNDLLSKHGWHLNALQRPAALHLCITAAHSAGIIELLLRDLRQAVEAALAVSAGKAENAREAWAECCGSVSQRWCVHACPAPDPARLVDTDCRRAPPAWPALLPACPAPTGPQGGRRWHGPSVRHGGGGA